MDPFDCERLGVGLLSQPVNSVSSLAFVAAAVVLWRKGLRLESVVLAVAGIGSVWFHAEPSGAGEWLHDIGLYAAIAVAAIAVWRRLAGSDPPTTASGVFLIGAILWFFSRSEGPLCDPDSVIQGHAAWHVLAATAFLLLFAGTRATAGDV